VEGLAFLHVAPALSLVDPSFVAAPHHCAGVLVIAFRNASVATIEQHLRGFERGWPLAAIPFYSQRNGLGPNTSHRFAISTWDFQHQFRISHCDSDRTSLPGTRL